MYQILHMVALINTDILVLRREPVQYPGVGTIKDTELTDLYHQPSSDLITAASYSLGRNLLQKT